MSTATACDLPELWTVGAKVVLADDHPVLRDGLRRSLEAEGLEVVADVADGRQAVAAVERELPDVALMDISMPSMDGIKATEVIHARHPKIAVLIFTLSTDEELHRRAEAAGARGVLTKDSSAADVISAIAWALQPGDGPIPHSARDNLRGGELSLTVRELEVLRMITKGASTEAIAAKLYISLKTVKNHLASIYDKLDVTDRTQAVLRALRLGLVTLD